MKEALDAARGLAVSGDTVLLSPACSSFDEFKSYTERGRIFKELVAQLIEDAS
jgi:UDP-N-acetylmuramoylalanine--D-glutamate ligase